jgi:hypothetical protein
MLGADRVLLVLACSWEDDNPVSSFSESASSLSKAGSLPQQASLPSPALGSLPQTQSYVYKHAGLTVSQPAAVVPVMAGIAYQVPAMKHLLCDLACLHRSRTSRVTCVHLPMMMRSRLTCDPAGQSGA